MPVRLSGLAPFHTHSSIAPSPTVLGHSYTSMCVPPIGTRGKRSLLAISAKELSSSLFFADVRTGPSGYAIATYPKNAHVVVEGGTLHDHECARIPVCDGLGLL